MERIYRVFVSSTMIDLEERRDDVIRAIASIGHIPVGMELFHATTLRTDAYISQKIENSDFLVFLLGEGSGSSMDGSEDGRKWIEFELNTAERLGKPIIAFLLDGKEVRGMNVDPRMIEIRERVKSMGQVVSFFSLAQGRDFSGQVIRAVESEARRLSVAKVGGLVSAKEYDRLSRLKHFSPTQTASVLFGRLMDSLSSYEFLWDRGNKQYEQKKLLAEFFWSTSLGEIALEKRPKTLFFEAGSTTDILLLSFLDKLSKPLFTNSRHVREGIEIALNSPVQMSYFALRDHETPFVRRWYSYPSGVASKNYGKYLGDIERNVIPATASRVRNGNFPRAVEQETREFAEKLDSDLGAERALAFTSYTGFEMRDGDLFPFTENFKNLVFKRALNRSKIGRIFFFHSEKCVPDFPIREARYYDISVREMLASYSSVPLAFVAVLPDDNGALISAICDAIASDQEDVKFQSDVKSGFRRLYFFNSAFHKRFEVFDWDDSY